MKLLDPKKTAGNNPAVDAKKIEELIRIKKVMEKAGVVKKADYNLTPALGDGSSRVVRTGSFFVRMSPIK